nr:hypothetical protein [Nelson Picorna-like virus 8]
MNFVKSSGTENFSNSNNVSWNSNPIYRSPESAGVSWYDQSTHWDPASEGIFSISQNSTNNPVPHWASRDNDLAGIRSEFDKSSSKVAENSAQALAPNPISTPSTSSVPTPALGAAEASLPGKLDNAKGATKVASAVTGVAQTGLAVSSLTGPVGMAAMINAAAGAATSNAIDAGNRATIASDYVANSKVQGSQSGFQSSLVRDLDSAHATVTKAGSDIGGIAGPLGAWFGSLIANAIQDSGPTGSAGLYDQLKTGYSFEGRYNPQDTGAVNSQTTANLSGQSNITSNV